MWNERRLARRAAQGDTDAFAAIFRRYQQDLYRYCVAILGDPQDAQDALQNTMVKALHALPGEQREIELKPWLYRVAHNESIELRRRARRSEPLAEEVPASGASLEQRAADRRRLRDLLADIAELPERHRGALVMRELAGLDFEEIGAALGTSPGAARQVLYEARRGLQQMSEGREMECDALTALLSERDGRVARRRDVRAHLRDCGECRRFGEAIRDRRATLAGVAPLPAVAAAAIAKGVQSGTASSGASTAGLAGGASAGGATGASTGGAAGGAAAKVASTGAILKSAAAIVAVVGVSAVAVDHGRLFDAGGSSPGEPHRAAVAGTDPDGSAVAASGADRGGGSAGSVPRGAFKPGSQVEKVGLSRPGGRDTASIVAAHRKAGAAESNRTATDAGQSTEPGSPTSTTTAEVRPEHVPPARHRERPAPPEGPAHPQHPAHPDHPAHPVHPSHPDQGSRPERTTRPESSVPAGSAVEGIEPQPVATEHPEHPAHPTTPAEPEVAAEGTEATTESEPPAEPPGHAGK